MSSDTADPMFSAASADASDGLDDQEKQLRAILDHMPASVWTTDREFRVTSCLGGGLKAMGYDSREFAGVSVEEVFRGHERQDRIMAAHQRALAGETVAFETAWNGRDVLVRLQPLYEVAGEIAGTIGMSFDVTEQKRAEKKYRELFERNLAGVFRSNIAGRLIECNDSFAKMFGYATPAAMMAEVNTRQLYWNVADREGVITGLRRRGELRNFELRLRTREGTMLWGLLNEAIVRDEGEEVLEGTMIDITAMKAAEQQIEYQAFHDSLTDLPNRFLFNDRLRVALAHAKRHGRSVAVMILDLDHFKLINETMAHSAGDDLLRRVAARLIAGTRPEDTIARLGGDEFVFVLSDIQQASASAIVAQKLMEIVRQPFVIHGRELYVTASIGIAVAPHDGEDIETLVKNADSALYRAKEMGRNNFQFHTPSAQQRAEMRLTLETAMRHALERDEYFLVYQPQVALATGEITGFEALLRWNRPDVGVVAPKDFIPLAEETGAIVAVGEWVLRTACQQLREWQKIKPSLRMAINISPRQFQQENLTRLVEDTVEELGLDPSTLEIEITESLSMNESDLTIGRLSHFRAVGIRVALDDFGTGYSSLARLRYLPIDSIKIDRSFVMDLREQGPEHRIVQAVVTMARSLDLRIIAEGVETAEQQKILTALGCHEMQGYVFSRPLPKDEATLLL